jgi:hypothetical protein
MSTTQAVESVSAPQRFFKVLVDGKSCHGGSFSWSLPNGQPGEWHGHTGALRICQSGFHLTSDPIRWWKPDSKVFEAEIDGDVGSSPAEDDKVCVRKCRLLREVEWSEFQVWSEGHHVARAGQARASGSATVEAYDSATVRAYGSATVEAYGSATVRASDSATVRASDSATVRASDSATVRASDSATVEAYGSATVRAFDSATVEAYGSATVEAYGSATVRAYGSATVRASDSATVRASDSATVIRSRYHSPGSTVTLADGSEAVCVDRRGKVTCTIAKEVGV